MHPPLCCPVCRTPFRDTRGRETLRCPSCGAQYRTREGIPVLISPKFIDAFKETEQHFHDELSSSADNGPLDGRTMPYHLHFERPMQELPNGAAVAELACGTRADGIEIARAGKSVTSLDISPDAVLRARARAEREGIASRMRFVAADAEHLPFQDGSFDATFVAASFHHFPNQRDALKEMKRVTKPGGYVIWGVEPASWPYHTVFRVLRPVKRFIRSRRTRAYDSVADDTTEGYTETSIRRMFADAGLTIVDLKRVKCASELYDSGVRLAGRLFRRTLAPNLGVSRALARFDELGASVPLVKSLYWHFNVISKVPSFHAA